MAGTDARRRRPLRGPGFVDLHVHGGDNADFMDGTVQAFETVVRAHTRHGTTTIVPTSTVARHEQTIGFLQNTRALKAVGPQTGAGPWPGRRRTPLWSLFQRRQGGMPSQGSGAPADTGRVPSSTSSSPT